MSLRTLTLPSSRLWASTFRVVARPASTKAPTTATTTLPIQSSIPESNWKADQTFLLQDPLMSQLVNTIMKDGKKARAQRLVSDALLDIRLKTNSDPYTVLSHAITEASPLIKLTSARKGSKVVQVPTPLQERQRRRRAIVWILEAAAKRNEKKFPERLSAEILAIINGGSSVLAKKQQLHKSALANRANAQVPYNTMR